MALKSKYHRLKLWVELKMYILMSGDSYNQMVGEDGLLFHPVRVLKYSWQSD